MQNNYFKQIILLNNKGERGNESMEKRIISKKGILQVVAKAAELEANSIFYSWPPPCMGFLYQPKRPKKVKQ